MPASSEQAGPGSSSERPAVPGPLARTGTVVAAVLDIVAVICSLTVTGLMFFLVLARYVLGMSIVGMHELIMLAAVALYMVGAMIASRRRQQLTVEWLAGLITTPRWQAAHELLIAVLTTVVTVFFMVWAYRMFAWGLVRPQWTPGYQIPLWIPQAAIGVAAVGCFLYALRDILSAALKLRAA